MVAVFVDAFCVYSWMHFAFMQRSKGAILLQVILNSRTFELLMCFSLMVFICP